MTWYAIIFFSCFTLFVFNVFVSLVFGDNGTDFDTSSVFSLRGFTHFLFGFSTYLMLAEKFDGTIESSQPYHFTLLHYIIAIIFGLVFMFQLFRFFRIISVFNNTTDEKDIDFSGYDCKVLKNLDNGKYVVLVDTPSGLFRKTLRHRKNNKDINIGCHLRVAKNLETKEYVVL